MCGRRGLEVDSELQTYEISLTPAFRTQFDQVLSPIREERAAGRRPGGGASAAGAQQQTGTVVDIQQLYIPRYNEMVDL